MNRVRQIYKGRADWLQNPAQPQNAADEDTAIGETAIPDAGEVAPAVDPAEQEILDRVEQNRLAALERRRAWEQRQAEEKMASQMSEIDAINAAIADAELC
jgi:hypothetical protein